MVFYDIKLTFTLTLNSPSKQMEPHSISNHDKAVLTRIFNPNLPYGDTFEEEEQIEQPTGE